MTKTIKLGGIRTTFEDEGEGSVLLLIHGHPFDRSMWYPQIKVFASRGRRVLAPDLRGYGETAAGGRKTTLDVFAEDLSDLLRALSVQEPVVLCGLSMGGQIAMEFCKRHPERVGGLALVATSPQKETPVGKRSRVSTAIRLRTEGMRRYANEMLPKMLAQTTITSRPELSLYVLQMMRAAPADGCAAALLGRAERPGYEDVLSTFTHPSLVVAGDGDSFTSKGHASLMHKLLNGSEFVWMKGVGHMPNLEAAEDFNAALSRLLSRVDSARSAIVEPIHSPHAAARP